MPLSALERRQLMTSLCDLEAPTDDSEIQFSPNSSQVIYSTNLAWNHHKFQEHPRSTLWLAETNKSFSSRQITSGLFNDHCPRWNLDGTSLAFISDRAAPGMQWAIYGMHVRNGTVEGEVFPITATDSEQRIASLEFSPDGKALAYISTDPRSAAEKAREERGEDVQVWGENLSCARLRIVDLASKVVRSLADDLANRHVAGFCWSPDGTRLAIVSTRTPDIEEPWKTGSKISIWTIGGGNVLDLCTFPNVLLHTSWADDDKIYFISGTPEDQVCAGNAVYAVATDSSMECHKWERIGHGVVDDAQRLTVVDGRVVVQVQHGLQDEIYIGLSQQPRYSKPQQIEAFALAFPTDGSPTLLAVATSSVNKPVEVYITSGSDDRLIQLSSHGARFDDQHFGTCVPLTVRSDDNQAELDSLLLTPSKSSQIPPTPMPTIVLLHGGPNVRNTDSFNTLYYYWTPYLLRMGYSVLLTNYRGSPGKGKAFGSYSTRGVGKWDYEDVITLTNNAIELGYSDPKRLVVGGLSHGGFLTYLCSVRNGSRSPWKFAAAIPLAGITDVDTMALTSDVGATLVAEINGGRARAPWNVANDDIRSRRRAFASWEVSSAVKKSAETGEMVIPPMLILHGEKDERCPIEQAWGMRRALEAHGLPFEFVTYPRQQHLFSERNFWLDMAERVGMWCEKYIGPGVVQ